MPFTAVPTRPVSHLAYFTEQQYIQRRCEYIDGVIHKILPVDRTHQQILHNVLTALSPQIKGTPCELLHQDVCVGNGPHPMAGSPAGRHSYATDGCFVLPDIAIVMDDKTYFVPSHTVITNPRVVLDIVLPDEEDHFTGPRFEALRTWLDPKFCDYVVIATNRGAVAHYTRQGRDWGLQVLTDFDAVLRLSRVGCSLMLGEIYTHIRDKAGRPFIRPEV